MDIFLARDKGHHKVLPALKQSGVIGCAVIMPYKVTMLSAVDELTEEARMVGAIDNIFLRRAEDGKTRYIGTNTDTSGIREAFLRNYFSASCAVIRKTGSGDWWWGSL